MKSTPLYFGVTITAFLTLAGFFVYPAMVNFIYPNVGAESLEQYFYSQVITALSFTCLGSLIWAYGWAYLKRHPEASPLKAFMAPLLVASATVIVGVLYYKLGLENVNVGNDIAGYPILMMAHDIKLHYIPVTAGLMVILLLAYKWLKGR